MKENEVENLQKENAELQETIEANLRVHKAAEKADAERIWNLQNEIAKLRDALESIFDDMCINCTKSNECNNLRTRCSQWVAAQSALKGEK